jgi:hypothetical protein
VTMFSDLLRRDRERYGLRIGQAAWLLVTPADTERLEQGERWPDWTTYDRICTEYGWPRSFR